MPGYQTKQEQITIRGVNDLLIRSLLDRQQFADPHGEAEALGISSAMWPLFGMLWPSSRHLAAYMATRPVIAAERILEVGCGLALASLVCHRRGANVTASDCHPLASSFLITNTGLNDMSPLPYRHGDWGADPEQLLHAQHPVVKGQFDVIMGSDVLYERDDLGHLPQFIGRHAKTQVEILIVDPNRGNRSAFNRRMAHDGFSLEEIDLSHAAHDDEAPYKGRLLRYLREGSEQG